MENEIDFVAAVSRLLPLILREFTRTQDNVIAKGDLTVPQVVVLELLVEKGPAQMNQLARALNLTSGAVTAIIDRLIKQRLVKRERSTSDRRVVNVLILEKGIKTVEWIKQARQNGLRSFFTALSSEDKLEYLRILQKIYDNIRKEQ